MAYVMELSYLRIKVVLNAYQKLCQHGKEEESIAAQ